MPSGIEKGLKQLINPKNSMHSRRRLIYYTIIATSLLWIGGTVLFIFLDDIEVTVAVKRKLAEDISSFSNEAESFKKLNDKILGKDRFNVKSKEKDIVNILSKEHLNVINSNLGAIRFANYEHKLVKRDPNLPGELGHGVTVGSSEKEKEKEGYDRHAFNQLVSDKISIHRSLEDYRNDK